MDHDVQRLLKYLSEAAESTHTSGPSWFGENPDAELLDSFSRAVTGVVGKVAPSVIAIPDSNPASPAGSGLVVSPDGFAVTTCGVLRGRTRITVVTHDGERVDAVVIGADPETDVALVKIAAKGFLHAAIGRSSLVQAGQFAVSVTNPLGLQSTVSSGTVRAVGRLARGAWGDLIEEVIEHTLSLSPDDVGGPLADSRGHVIGLNAGLSAGPAPIGWAIASETVSWVISELLRHGRVRRARIGVRVGAARVNKIAIRELDLMSEHGVRVLAVEPGGPAEAGGVREGDVITSVCGRLVGSAGEMRRVLAKTPIGATIPLTIVRHGSLIERSVVARA